MWYHRSIFLDFPFSMHAFASLLPASDLFSLTAHNNPHARTAANNPVPAAGPSATAAPELFVGVADPLGEAPPWTLASATPLTPVAFWHWSLARSWAVELKRMSAHYDVLVLQTFFCIVLNDGGSLGKEETYVVQSTSPFTKLNDLNTSIQPIQSRIIQARVSSSLEPRLKIGAGSFLYSYQQIYSSARLLHGKRTLKQKTPGPV